MATRRPVTEHEWNVSNTYREVGTEAYRLGVDFFEHIGENGVMDDDKPRDRLLWGNGHHMAQALCQKAQDIFYEHLDEKDQDLVRDPEVHPKKGILHRIRRITEGPLSRLGRA